jgi:cyclopropane-fatty-acyl-phospholipid synthase
MWYIHLVQSNLVPDWLIRLGVRVMLAAGLKRRYRAGLAAQNANKRTLIEKLRQSPIAIRTDVPNLQHYEVPPEFFRIVLGKWLKYSCCHWSQGVETLDGAEEAMLRLTCERARIKDGMDILDLGCGWGSLCLWIAEHYPHSRVSAVSNSHSQRAFIEQRCRERGIANVDAITADVSNLNIQHRFDRVVSVEMFEHMKNYELLMARIASMLKPDGLLFVHIFSHREFAYEFDAGDPDNWMAQTFFTGGTMPSDDLLLHFQHDLQLVDHWRIDGTHYARTLNAWLAKLDRHKAQVRRVLAGTYGTDKAQEWLRNWRLFFIACEETFGFRRGREYLISHYLFDKR